MNYTAYKLKGFDVYRRWFNRNFSLSFNGKFVGLLRLGDKLELFIHRLGKYLNRPLNPWTKTPDIITIKLSGDVVKLYNR